MKKPIVLIIEAEIEAKVTSLTDLGCTDIEAGNDLFIDFTTPSGEMCNVGLYDFDTIDTLEKILHHAQKYTCCGDLIDYDGDSDICPTCKEHC